MAGKEQLAGSGRGGFRAVAGESAREQEYEAFLTDLQSVVAERVEELRARRSTEPPAAFLDDDKVVREWPDPTGRILEELR